MNLHFKPILPGVIIVLSFLSGCVKNDSDTCGPQGVDIYFYSKMQCQTDTVYPSYIHDLTIGIFDKDDRLVAYTQNANVNLDKNYFQEFEVPGGLYTVVTWAGVDNNHYTITPFQTGITKKEDLMFRLKRDGNRAYSIAGERVYYGESPGVYIPENLAKAPLFEKVGVNMQEITNRITIIVEGLDNVADYDVMIETDNGSMNVNGTIATDEVVECGVEYQRDGVSLVAQFTLLKLETGRSNTIIIKNTVLGVELFRGNLLGTLLLKNPEVNLDCDHDFVINFTTEDQCECGEYIIQEIRVNNWLVHSYQKEM